MHRFFKSDFFNFEFVRVLGTAPFGGADTAECLDAASQIRDGDPESWHRAWLAQAHRAEGLARDACQHGDRAAARDAYLRCSNYYRAAHYMFSDRKQAPEPRVCEFSELSIARFQQAIQLLDSKVKTLSIPYENDAVLAGYLYLPLPKKRLPGKIPVLIVCGGADSTQEELYSLYPAAGVERGYAVVTYDGPGQGRALRHDKMHMRPDWETALAYVLDHLQLLGPDLELDMDRTAVAGVSMGAYYALRGASDPRVAACVSIDPIYDMWDLATDRMPPWFINAWLSGWLTDGFVNTWWRGMSAFHFQLRWELTHCMWIFDVETAALALKEMRRWTLRDGKAGPFLANVQCPVLVTGAAGTIYSRPEISTLKVAKDLSHLESGKKEVWIAEAAADGGLQGKVGAWRLVQQRTFAFLDSHLAITRQSLPMTTSMQE